MKARGMFHCDADIIKTVKQFVVMTHDRRESFRKWGTLLASTLALLVTSLRDPIALAFKAKQDEVLRRELSLYETVSAAEARWEKHLDSQSEIPQHLDRELAALRDGAVASEATYKLLLEINNCLMAVETKLDLLMKERQRDRLQSSASAPQ